MIKNHDEHWILMAVLNSAAYLKVEATRNQVAISGSSLIKRQAGL